MRPYQPGQDTFNLIQTAIPEFVESEYPMFVEFVTQFLHYLEQARTFANTNVYPDYGTVANSQSQITVAVGGPAYEARKLLEYRDIGSTLDEFTPHFLSMFAKNFPQRTQVSAQRLVESLRQFYQQKGTLNTVQWFFRIIFNEHANVYFPREDILKASDGTWSAPTTIKVSPPTDGHVNSDVDVYYVGQRIATATGSAQVEQVVTNIFGQSEGERIVVNELILKFGTVVGVFVYGQDLFNIDSIETVHTTILPVISGVNIIDGGSDYAVGDLVSFSEGRSGGGGFGATGIVAQVSNTALNGLTVLDGGDGYLTGLPVDFESSTGTAAEAEVDQIIYGNILLEVEDGNLLTEQQFLNEKEYFALEDRNTLLLELTIELFVNASATVTLDSPDYGVATGATELDGITITDPLEIALDASEVAPFMHPWVFTNPSTVLLCNAEILTQLTTNTYFANSGNLFVISGADDTTTNTITSLITAVVVVSDLTPGLNRDRLYLSNITNLTAFSAGMLVKAGGTGTLQLGTVTTNVSANVYGTDTTFTKVVGPNTHIRLSDGSHHAVKTVVNNTLLIMYANTDVVLTNSAWSTIPVGNITQFVPQAQRYYGKIRHIAITNPGIGYLTPPSVTIDSISARAQEITYEDFSSDFIAADGRVSDYVEASLEANQDAGQVTKINITSSGVNYIDANSIQIMVHHAFGIMSANAICTPLLGAITTYPGSWTTTRGFLSSDKFLQNQDYYNDYTYVVRVGESFNRYQDFLLDLIHPAGFKVLGEFVLVVEADADSTPLLMNSEDALVTIAIQLQ